MIIVTRASTHNGNLVLNQEAFTKNTIDDIPIWIAKELEKVVCVREELNLSRVIETVIEQMRLPQGNVYFTIAEVEHNNNPWCLDIMECMTQYPFFKTDNPGVEIFFYFFLA